MKRPTHILAVERSATGTYLVADDHLHAVMTAMFGDDHDLWHRLGRAIDGLRDDFSKLPVVCHVDGWRRPFFDVLMDLVDFVHRADGQMGFMKIEAVFGDDAEAFIGRALARGVRVFHAEPPGMMPLPVLFPRAEPAADERFYIAARSWDGTLVQIPYAKIGNYNDWHDADVASSTPLELPTWANVADLDNLTFTDPQPVDGAAS